MLNVAKLSPSGYAYYLLPTPNGTLLREKWMTRDEALAKDQGTGLPSSLGRSIPTEENGIWVGSGLEQAGIYGEVGEAGMQRLFEGKHPLTGEPLRNARYENRVRIAAFDLAFCAPKSLSVIHALAQSPVAHAVKESHELAVQGALSYAEESVFRARRRSAGQDLRLSTRGVLGAAFLHRTSRSLDPHLHSHVVVANVAQGTDGKWSALDARDLYRQMRTMGVLYQAHLRFEVTRRLGVSWREVIPGIADVSEVPREVVELFSKRSRQMRSWLEERGLEGRSRKAAFFATRAEKSFEHSWEELREDWQLQVRSLGWEMGKAISLRDLGREPSAPSGLAVLGREPPVPSGLAVLGPEPPVPSRREGVLHDSLARSGILGQLKTEQLALMPDVTRAKALVLERLQEECEARLSRQRSQSAVLHDGPQRPNPLRDPHEVLRACCTVFPTGIEAASAVRLTKLLLENGILQELEGELALGGRSRPSLAKERQVPLAPDSTLPQAPPERLDPVSGGQLPCAGTERGLGRTISRDALVLREQDVARAAGVPFVGIGRAEAAARAMGLLDEEVIFPCKGIRMATEPRRSLAEIGKELETLARELQFSGMHDLNGSLRKESLGQDQEEKLRRYASSRKEYLERVLRVASSRKFPDLGLLPQTGLVVHEKGLDADVGRLPSSRGPDPFTTRSALVSRTSRLEALWRIAEASHAERWGDDSVTAPCSDRTATRTAHKCFRDALRNDLEASLEMVRAREPSAPHAMVRAREASRSLEREKFRSPMEGPEIELYR